MGLILSISFGISQAQTYQPTPENLKNRAKFQDNKYGLFVHWGVYSLLADGEWVMYHKQIPVTAYEKLPSNFNPTQFNAEAWVKMVKAAGMKYITITSRHHDGFSMFATKQNKYNIVDGTPYGKDPLKQLADACRKEGIDLFFYYSLLDWWHPDYFTPDYNNNKWAGRAYTGKWENYRQYMKNQLTELLTNYGPIAGIWFDGMWERKDSPWNMEDIYKHIHSIQPACLVGNNHHAKVIAGEDYQMFEKDLPGQNSSGWLTSDHEISALPLETCETMNGSWGFNLKDRKFKSTRGLVHYLIKAAGNNSNFLLNVGPMPNGQIQPEFTDTLAKVGKWLAKYGESIYGTCGGKVFSAGVTTQKGNVTYLHILSPVGKTIFLEDMPQVKKATCLTTGKTLKVTKLKEGILLEAPNTPANEYSGLVKLE